MIHMHSFTNRVLHSSAGVRYLATCAILLISTLPLSAQVQKQGLVATLKGSGEVASTIDLGGTCIPPESPVPYQVNTLVYPDGQVIFRVEFGLMRQEVTQMQTSFASGSKFRVASVALKDDVLELKLIARNMETAKLKLMLGAGWQARMSNGDVFAVLNRFLIYPETTDTAR